MRELLQDTRALLSVTVLLLFVVNSCSENSVYVSYTDEVSAGVDSSDAVDSPEKYQAILDTALGERIHILSIGLTHYNDPVISETLYADNDAKIFAGLWQEAVPPKNIHLLTDEKATKSHVKRLITNQLSRVSRDDLVYIFFAGHGDIVKEAGKQVSGLLFYDAEQDNPGTYYKIRELMDDLKKNIEARNLLLILDSCHSGAAGLLRSADKKEVTETIDAKEIEKQISRIGYNWGVLTACRPDEKSRASHEYSQGFFTYWLKLGLVGWADRDLEGTSGNEDGVVTFKELFDFVYKMVREDTGGNQTPVLSGVFHTETVMCKAGDKLPAIVKAGISALLEIKVKPAEAKVTCDGKPITLYKQEKDYAYFNLVLNPGEHNLRVTSEGYQTQTGTVSLIGGERKVVIAELKRTGSPGDIPNPF
ncbi:caspase family protein [Planctomycetota bacterium]